MIESRRRFKLLKTDSDIADSMPRDVLKKMKKDMDQNAEKKRDLALRQKIESWLDAGHGSCILGRPDAARCVVENWHYFNGSRYWLIAGVVMPNHVHVLIRMLEGATLGKVVQSWKSYTSKRIAGMMKGRSGARRPRGGEHWLHASQ